MVLNPLRRRVEPKAALTDQEMLDLAFGFMTTTYGYNVTQDTALKSTAVIACLIVRAETFASLPVHVYKHVGDSREQVSGHPLDALMGRAWNPLMTSVEGWRWKQLTEDIRGKALVRVERRGGKPVNFWPMTNKRVTIRYDAASAMAVYDYEGDPFTTKSSYSSADMLHFKGPLVKDAWDGTSLVDQAKTAIGLTITSEQFYDRLLSNGNHFPGYLATDQALDEASVQAIAKRMQELAGIDHAGEMRIFDRGLKYEQNPMTIKDADLTAQQLWYLQEVCRVFRVPPPLVQDWSRSTYTNADQADIWFAKHTILPIAVNTERVVERLFVNRNEPDHYVKFALDGLMRGDYLTRMQGHEIGIRSGQLAPNEARKLEDRDPYDGGDEFIRPLNMGSVTDEATPIVSDFTALLDDARERIVRRAVQDRERGRDSDVTRAFAEKVAAPLAAAGVLTDPDAFCEEVLRG